MLKDLVNKTNEEIEQSAQKAVDIIDEGDYYANGLYKINLCVASCEAIINDKTPFSKVIYRPKEPGFVKVKERAK